MYVHLAIGVVRRLTGVGVRHLVLAAILLVAAMGTLTWAFWWLAERADGALGTLGAIAVALAWASTAALLVAGSAAVAARILAGRAARTLRAAVSSGAGSRHTTRG